LFVPVLLPCGRLRQENTKQISDSRGRGNKDTCIRVTLIISQGTKMLIIENLSGSTFYDNHVFRAVSRQVSSCFFLCDCEWRRRRQNRNQLSHCCRNVRMGAGLWRIQRRRRLFFSVQFHAQCALLDYSDDVRRLKFSTQSQKQGLTFFFPRPRTRASRSRTRTPLSGLDAKARS